MKQLLIPFLFLCMIIACQKEPVQINKPPVAIAGNDTTIVLPVDNVLLNGSASYDGDGKIKTYRWRQISGSQTATIMDPQQAIVHATKLSAGEYRFELKATDDQDLSSTDTMIVRVNSALSLKADAGSNQIIIHPRIAATLDGTASADPTGISLNFHWKQIAGENSVIGSPNDGKTQVFFNKPGHYQYELKIHNSNGVAYDTTTITVNNGPDCTVSRTKVNPRIDLLKQLPTRVGLAGMIAVGNKLLFPPMAPISLDNDRGLLYIYDLVTGELSNTEMNLPQIGYTTTVAGNKIFFAGGNMYDQVTRDILGATDLVQIYDLSSNTWTTTKLSEPRGMIAAAVHNDKVYFAGGIKRDKNFSRMVDIFDIQTGTWSASELKGAARVIQQAVTAQNKIFFLGGYTKWEARADLGYTFYTTPTRTIDIFNPQNGQWDIDEMREARFYLSATALEDKIYIAGDVVPNNSQMPTSEVINADNYSHSYICLSHPYLLSVLSKNSTIVFINEGGDVLEIYNSITGQWSIAETAFSSYSSIAFANSELYVLEGGKLYKMDF